MAKTANVFARVEPDVKEQAEEILSLLGMSVSTAFGLFLKQVVLEKGLPFDVKLPVEAAEQAEFDASMQEAWEQMERGEGFSANEIKDELTKQYGIQF